MALDWFMPPGLTFSFGRGETVPVPIFVLSLPVGEVLSLVRMSLPRQEMEYTPCPVYHPICPDLLNPRYLYAVLPSLSLMFCFFKQLNLLITGPFHSQNKFFLNYNILQ